MVLKRFYNKTPMMSVCSIVAAFLILQGCSTNSATGRQQFTALMSPAQEEQVGAQEHEKVIAQFGLYEDKPELISYVRTVGRNVTRKTERPDVEYTFYVLDSPIVNAFALPGGYIYISRGLLALANNEAQMSAVLSHEAGHITGRHSAERYSHGVVTSVGASILSIAIGNAAASQALGVGANLYLSAYSRDQENEADSLGLRYMTQGGYAPDEMAAFLSALHMQSNLDARLAGQEGKVDAAAGYFSTHPATGDRVKKTSMEAQNYRTAGGVEKVNRESYLRQIEGMVYGDSAKQGFTHGQTFYHPGIGFTFTAPDNFQIINQNNVIIAKKIGPATPGTLMLFDLAKKEGASTPARYISDIWLNDKQGLKIETTTVHEMPAATTSYEGTLNGASVTLRTMVIAFSSDQYARFQMAIPKNASSSELEALRRATYSFRRMTSYEKQTIKPYKLGLITAKKGDTIASLAQKMPYKRLQEERFRTLNALLPNEALTPGRIYKTVVK